MVKRKNALSKARGKQKRAENVWFKRTGAGYRLFVEYYAAQPIGTVAENTSTDAPASNKKKLAIKQGQGMSRAAKRRKKKKNSSFEVQAASIATLDNDIEPLSSSHFTQAELATHLRPFLISMSKPLPLTFRLRQTADNTAEIQKTLSEYSHILSPLPFDSNVYQARMSKAALASESPELRDLLIQHSQDGTLARQELGSMLPVLLLQKAGYLLSTSRVLDMCASPGSKTMQALEVTGESGRIVANDVLESRLDALKDAVKRSGIPESLTNRITYSNQDATQLSLRTEQWANVILCDVPCSGDGTCRKDKHILPMWKPNTANQLHGTQVDILVRALELVKVGGVACYSTCSLNPVEDEAVVAEALRSATSNDDSSQTTVELVDCPELPGMIRREGIYEWKVADYVDEDEETTKNDNDAADEEEMVRLRWHKTCQDAVEAKMDKPRKSLWPSSDNSKLHLERCVRLWPQDQDSGGFFLALIRKNKR